MALPKPTEQENGGEDFNAFLTPKHIGNGKPGAKCEVLAIGARDELIDSQFGQQMVVEVKLGKETLDLAIKVNSPNYRMLFQRFGNNPKKWRGKIALEIRKPIRKGFRPFIGVVRG